MLWPYRHSLLRIAKVACCIAIASLALPLFAQRYTYRQYGAQQGLTNLVVQCLFQDREGYLWIGTDNGLFRYNGNAFEGFFRKDGLPNQFVLNLAEGPDGAIWVSTPSGFVRRIGERFLAVESGLAPNAHYAPGFDDAGRTYLVRGDGLARADNASGSGFGLLVPGKLSALYVKGSRVWFSKESDIWQLDGNKAQPFGSVRGLPADDWRALLEDGEKNLWVRSATRLYMLPKGGQRFIDHSAQVETCSGSGCRLAADPQGGILVPTNIGVVALSGGGRLMMDAAHGLPVQTIEAALITRDGSLWLGSFGGGLLRRLGRGEWISWQKEDGLLHNTIWAIQRDSKGRTWLGSNDGLTLMDSSGKVLRTWTRRDGLNGNRVELITIAPDGSVFADMRPNGLVRIDTAGRVHTNVAPPTNVPGTRLMGMALDTEGRLWVATQSFVLRSRQAVDNAGAAVQFDRVEVPGLISQDILGLSVGPTGTVWIGCKTGLRRWAEGRWRIFTVADGLRSDSVSGALEKDGVVWFRYYDSLGLGRMVVRPDGVKLENFSSANGPRSDAVYGMAFDSANRLWTITDNGADVLANGRWRHYGAENGLISNDCDEGALYADADGVWVGTSNGLSKFSTKRAVDEAPPRLAFSLIEGGSKRWLAAEQPVLPYAQRSLRIQFGSLEFYREAGLQFRYRLEGEDRTWTETREHGVQYQGLQPGEHRFEVVAAGADGAWSSPLRLNFTILTPWWQTWWFRSLMVLLAGLAAKMVWRMRLRILLAQKEELENLVAERTAQLQQSHQRLEEIAYLDSLTMLPNRRMFSQEFERRLVRGARYKESFTLLLIDLDRFKPINDTHGHDAGDAVLVETARRLREVIREDDCVARLGGDEFAVLLTHLENDPGVDGVCQRIAEVVSREIEFRGVSLQVGLSLGAAKFPEHGWTQEDLYKAADIALYAAKRRSAGDLCWLVAGATVATD